MDFSKLTDKLSDLAEKGGDMIEDAFSTFQREAERRAQLHGEHRAARNAQRLADRVFEHARAA